MSLPAQLQAQIDMINRSERNFEEFRRTQNLKLPALKHQDLSQKNVIITGANAGLGYEVAKAIAAMKPKLLILACRNLEKAKEAVDSLKKATGYSTIEIEELDLSSFDNTKAFIKRVLARNIAIDVLISNAGIASFHEWVVTKDGYEIQLQVNHLANALMVLSLVPALRKSSNPRVEIVASEVHFWPPLPEASDPTPIKTLNVKTERTMQYPSTKLLNVVFAQEFARRFPDIYICSTNPGYCMSELGVKNMETGGDKKDKHNNFEAVGIPLRETAEGAKTLVYAAIDPEAKESGGYYSNVEAEQPRSITLGESGKKFGANVWSDTMEALYKVADKNSIPQN